MSIIIIKNVDTERRYEPSFVLGEKKYTENDYKLHKYVTDAHYTVILFHGYLTKLSFLTQSHYFVFVIVNLTK